VKVFIADDSSLILERLAALITELETVDLVGQAEDGTAALEAVRRLKPDVAILDIRMPGLNCLQVVKGVKREANAPIVIILTAFPYPQYRRRYLAAGAEYFLDKIVDFDNIGQLLLDLQARDPDGNDPALVNDLVQ
jgi:DNA-binding NarL/FixJ family response regulator